MSRAKVAVWNVDFRAKKKKKKTKARNILDSDTHGALSLHTTGQMKRMRGPLINTMSEMKVSCTVGRVTSRTGIQPCQPKLFHDLSRRGLNPI
jgi:hypothetical protein